MFLTPFLFIIYIYIMISSNPTLYFRICLYFQVFFLLFNNAFMIEPSQSRQHEHSFLMVLDLHRTIISLIDSLITQIINILVTLKIINHLRLYFTLIRSILLLIMDIQIIESVISLSELNMII